MEGFRCKHCKQVLSPDAFSPMPASSSGLRQYCKKCTNSLSKYPSRLSKPEAKWGVNKECTICKRVKPLSAFDASKQSIDGYRRQCKVCLSKLT